MRASEHSLCMPELRTCRPATFGLPRKSEENNVGANRMIYTFQICGLLYQAEIALALTPLQVLGIRFRCQVQCALLSSLPPARRPLGSVTQRLHHTADFPRRPPGHKSEKKAKSGVFATNSEPGPRLARIILTDGSRGIFNPPQDPNLRFLTTRSCP